MIIDYANRRIQKVCANLKRMQKELGAVRAKTLNTRLTQLQRGENLESLRNEPEDWHELTQNREGQHRSSLSIDFCAA